jgi:Ca-activated chloride channel family protein
MATPTDFSSDERLTAYAFGELDDADRAEFERQLAESPELQAELQELQNLAGLLRTELSAEAAPSLTQPQRESLLKQASEPATSEESVAVDKVRQRRRRWALIGAEIAAGTAIAVGFWNAPALMKHSSLAESEMRPLANVAKQRLQGIESELVVEQREFDHPETEGITLLSDLDSTAAPTGGSALMARPGPMVNGPGPGPIRFDASQPVDGLSATVHSGDEAGEGRGVVFRPTGEVEFKRFSTSAAGAKDAAPGGPPASSEERRPVSPGLERNRAKHPDPGSPAETEYARRSEREHSHESLGVFHDGETAPKSETATAEAYEAPQENAFQTPAQQPLSTFSVDVDSASYSNIRRFLTQGQLPPPAAVRIEEMINSFTYNYPQPAEGEPFSVTADAAPCPWERDHYLARIALRARSIDKAKRPPTNLVFLLDVSGSMQAANKLPLVKQAMTMLTEELNERDRIAIVTYAGDAGLKLASTPGSDQVRIMQAIEALQAGGSTNGAAGINLAYEEALRSFNGEGENRVILCTDGDFNVGVSSDDQLVQLIQQQAKTKVFLSIFGFGMGNLKDAKLEKLADKGNGHYGYIDDLREARRVFNEELTGTLYTVAKDVKIQVEFNPLTVGAYRLIGYENRALAARDFNDDTKDAGEIGAGHTVTALYEIVPRGKWPKTQPVDPLKYSATATDPAPRNDGAVKPAVPAESADDLFTVKLRYKQPTGDSSVKTVDHVVDDIAGKKVVAPADFQWAAAVAAFGMQLKQSSFKGQWTLDDVIEAAEAARGEDANGRRREFLDLVRAVKRLNPAAAGRRGI